MHGVVDALLCGIIALKDFSNNPFVEATDYKHQLYVVTK